MLCCAVEWAMICHAAWCSISVPEEGRSKNQDDELCSHWRLKLWLSVVARL